MIEPTISCSIVEFWGLVPYNRHIIEGCFYNVAFLGDSLVEIYFEINIFFWRLLVVNPPWYSYAVTTIMQYTILPTWMHYNLAQLYNIRLGANSIFLCIGCTMVGFEAYAYCQLVHFERGCLILRLKDDDAYVQ